MEGCSDGDGAFGPPGEGGGAGLTATGGKERLGFEAGAAGERAGFEDEGERAGFEAGEAAGERAGLEDEGERAGLEAGGAGSEERAGLEDEDEADGEPEEDEPGSAGLTVTTGGTESGLNGSGRP